MKLRGTFTALATPFNADGSIDFGALDALVDSNLEGGVSGLVPCGTTGEAATLDDDERFSVVEWVARRASGVPIIAGTGTNNTAQSVELHRRAADHGATHSLAVTPYYNKPTPAGLIAHYSAMADAAPLPIVLYNVPGRTGCDMQPEVVIELAKNPRIVAIKEATGDLDRVTTLRRETREDFAILSGDDPTAAALVFAGGDGVVSVCSNFAPKEMSGLIQAALDGDVHRSRALQNRLQLLNAALFVESNPIPLKAALAMKGIGSEHYRLPLVPMAPSNRARLEAVLRDDGWL